MPLSSGPLPKVVRNRNVVSRVPVEGPVYIERPNRLHAAIVLLFLTVMFSGIAWWVAVDEGVDWSIYWLLLLIPICCFCAFLRYCFGMMPYFRIDDDAIVYCEDKMGWADRIPFSEWMLTVQEHSVVSPELGSHVLRDFYRATTLHGDQEISVLLFRADRNERDVLQAYFTGLEFRFVPAGS